MRGAAVRRAGRQARGARAHRLDRLEAAGRLTRAWLRLAENAAGGLERAGALLESCSHRRVLERGFALVRDEQGPVVSAEDARSRDRVGLVFADGEASARILQEDRDRRSKPDQGSLF